MGIPIVNRQSSIVNPEVVLEALFTSRHGFH
jgi:hypothetical protein